MPLDYSHYRTSSVISSTRKKIIYPVQPDDPSLLDDVNQDDSPGEITEKDLLDSTPEKITVEQHDVGIMENTNYGPDRFYNTSSPIAQETDDQTEPVHELDQITSNQPLLQSDNDSKPSNVLSSDHNRGEHPREIVSYYNEAALTANRRNALPDEVFGLPKTRQYPLHDRKHVHQAILMFRHCKSSADQKVLAANIEKAMKRFNMTTKIGPKNPLSKYIKPESMNESSDRLLQNTVRDALLDSDVQKDRVQYNSIFLNTRFYCEDFNKIAEDAIRDNHLMFLDRCYPNLVTHNFYVRLHSSLGKLGACQDIYQEMGIRYPFSDVHTGSISVSIKVDDRIPYLIDSYYDNSYNWFKMDLSDDVDHVLYCMNLYAILGEILLNPTFTESVLKLDHLTVLNAWIDRVSYHYDLLKMQEPDSKPYYREAQYLHDLMWNFLDDPDSEEMKAYFMCQFVTNMASSNTNSDDRAMRDHSLYTKADATAYLINAMNKDDSIWLIPEMLEYPIINRYSVRLAVDMIHRIISDYPDYVGEYTTNLNRKYHDMGCTFRIPSDHPYVKYAPKEMVDDFLVLTEGETAVDDPGTSISGNPNDVDVPWYKRYDVSGYLYRDGLENKERGPNDTKPVKSTDLVHTDSFL